MAKREIQVGTTSRRERVFIADTSQTNGAGLTGLAYNASGLTWKFIRDDQTSLTTVTPVTASVGTWTSSGFVEIGAGIYELGLPNAALASSTGVIMELYGAANMAVTKIEIELTATNNQDAVRGGMTALPNANAGGNGGLPQLNSAGNVPADLQTIKTQNVAAAGSVTFPSTVGSSGPTGTAQGGTSATITLASAASSLDNYYTGQTLVTTGGTGPNQTRIITGYVGSTRVATVDAAWVTTPDSTTTYLLPGVKPAVLRSINITS